VRCLFVLMSVACLLFDVWLVVCLLFGCYCWWSLLFLMCVILIIILLRQAHSESTGIMMKVTQEATVRYEVTYKGKSLPGRKVPSATRSSKKTRSASRRATSQESGIMT
jgi:hypothetical protein